MSGELDRQPASGMLVKAISAKNRVKTEFESRFAPKNVTRVSENGQNKTETTKIRYILLERLALWVWHRLA